MTDKKAKTYMLDKPVELDASKTYEVESTSTDSGQLQPASISEIAGNEMTEEYKLSLGDGIDESISAAILLAKRSGKTYWFKFNGTKVIVTSKSTISHILGLYYLAGEGDEIGPYFDKEKQTEEPKLYDYYFYAAHNDVAAVSGIFKASSGEDLDLAFDNVAANAKKHLKTESANITAFNFIKTGP